MNGTHLPNTKKQLSALERELLVDLLELQGSMKTAKEVSRLMNWDIRQTTATLSNIVGMDLCIETDASTKVTDTETHEFSSSEPFYGIPLDSIYHKRAKYASERKGDGVTLWHLLKGVPEFGEHLWPYRPVDRVKTSGHVKRNDDGRPVLTISVPKEMEDMVGQDVEIILKTKT